MSALRRLSRTGGVRLLNLDGVDLQSLCLNAHVNFAPLPCPGAAVLAAAPLPLSQSVDPGAADKKVRGTRAGAVEDRDGPADLATAERAEVPHRPVQLDRLQEARHQPGRPSQSRPEQRLQGAERLNCRIRRGLRVTALAAWALLHAGAKMDEQRPALLQGRAAGAPAGRVLGRRGGLAHARSLTHSPQQGNPGGFVRQRQWSLAPAFWRRSHKDFLER